MKITGNRTIYLLVLLLLIISDNAYGQSADKLIIGYQAKINLSRKSMADTSFDVAQQAYLIVNPRHSVFFVDSKADFSENSDDATGKVGFKATYDSMMKMQKNLAKNELICEEQGIGQLFWYRDSLHNQQWAITDSSRQIGGYPCRSATTFFRGRHYTAWFTPEIPLSNGPWKFGGLPGLILEAYDDERKVQFLFHSLKYTNAIANTKMPINKVITYPIFAAKFRAAAAKLVEFMKVKAMENAKEGRITTDFKIETIEVH